jgi:ABC-type uncharacterized transport system YnjBCD ATPase subunit
MMTLWSCSALLIRQVSIRPSDLILFAHTYLTIQNKIVVDVLYPSGTGQVDLDGFNKIAVHFLLKKAKHDHDQFIHKHQIGLNDFSE